MERQSPLVKRQSETGANSYRVTASTTPIESCSMKDGADPKSHKRLASVHSSSLFHALPDHFDIVSPKERQYQQFEADGRTDVAEKNKGKERALSSVIPTNQAFQRPGRLTPHACSTEYISPPNPARGYFTQSYFGDDLQTEEHQEYGLAKRRRMSLFRAEPYAARDSEQSRSNGMVSKSLQIAKSALNTLGALFSAPKTEFAASVDAFKADTSFVTKAPDPEGFEEPSVEYRKASVYQDDMVSLPDAQTRRKHGLFDQNYNESPTLNSIIPRFAAERAVINDQVPSLSISRTQKVEKDASLTRQASLQFSRYQSPSLFGRDECLRQPSHDQGSSPLRVPLVPTSPDGLVEKTTRAKSPLRSSIVTHVNPKPRKNILSVIKSIEKDYKDAVTFNDFRVFQNRRRGILGSEIKRLINAQKISLTSKYLDYEEGEKANREDGADRDAFATHGSTGASPSAPGEVSISLSSSSSGEDEGSQDKQQESENDGSKRSAPSVPCKVSLRNPSTLPSSTLEKTILAKALPEEESSHRQSYTLPVGLATQKAPAEIGSYPPSSLFGSSEGVPKGLVSAPAPAGDSNVPESISNKESLPLHAPTETEGANSTWAEKPSKTDTRQQHSIINQPTRSLAAKSPADNDTIPLTVCHQSKTSINTVEPASKTHASPNENADFLRMPRTEEFIAEIAQPNSSIYGEVETAQCLKSSASKTGLDLEPSTLKPTHEVDLTPSESTQAFKSILSADVNTTQLTKGSLSGEPPPTPHQPSSIFGQAEVVTRPINMLMPTSNDMESSDQKTILESLSNEPPASLFRADMLRANTNNTDLKTSTQLGSNVVSNPSSLFGADKTKAQSLFSNGSAETSRVSGPANLFAGGGLSSAFGTDFRSTPGFFGSTTPATAAVEGSKSLSIFGSSAASKTESSAQASNFNGPEGTQNVQSHPFGASTSGILFGGSSSEPLTSFGAGVPAKSEPLFGATSPTATTAGGLMGDKMSKGLFGVSPTFSTPVETKQDVFGRTDQVASQGTTFGGVEPSLFGTAPAVAVPSPTSSAITGGLFGTPVSPAPGLFAPSAGMFGNTANFGQPMARTTPSGAMSLFGGTSQEVSAEQPATNVFAAGAAAMATKPRYRIRRRQPGAG